MRTALGIILVTLGLMLPHRGFAQGPGPSVLWQRPTAPAANFGPPIDQHVAQAPDYRWEGLGIGAGAGALLFGLMGAAVCSYGDDDCVTVIVGVGLIGAVCGGVLGGVIGGMFPKEEPADTTADDVIEWGS